jgi:hypothetical protein
MFDETIGNQQAKSQELGWLAGIIDGEGYIGLRDCKNHNYIWYRPEMMIINTDEAIIKKTQSIMRKLGVNPYIRNGHNGQERAKMYYKVQIKNLAKMLMVLKPVEELLTGNKYQRAKYIIEFCESRLNRCKEGLNKNLKPYLPREIELVDLCKPLQKRGRASETLHEARLRSNQILKELRGVKIKSELTTKA